MKVLIALLIIGGVLIVLCCGGAIIGGYWFQGKIEKAVSTDPAVVQRVADGIAQIDLPPGFRPVMSLDIFQMTWAVLRSDSGHSSVVLAKFGALYQQQSEEELRRLLLQQLQAHQIVIDPAPGTQTSRQQQVQVRGQPVTFTITTGKDPVDGGQRIKAAGTITNGQERTLLVISVDADDFSEEQVVKMLESIK